VALVESPEHVCCRYRVAAFRPWLEAAGHSLELRPWPRRWWSRLRLGRALRDADVVVLQRRLLPVWLLYLLRCAAPRLVFDFDDAVFLRDSYSPKGLHSASRLHRFLATVETADAVVAGNAYLADEARRWAAAPSRVHVVPTCVDPERYPLARHERRGAGVELVWVGSASTLQGLEAVRPMLEEAGRAVPGARLKLVSDRFLRLDHLPVIECPWAEGREPVDLAAADVGISWLPDDLWSRGKCGLKVLQYMAAGLPVVANPVGVQAELVRHGETGFLARTPGEWVGALRRLATDPELRRRLGAAGRRRVEADFSVAAGAARWLNVLHGLLARPTRRQGTGAGEDAA
jgi:glycosyltransferase involved in cell wall biosynthesis